MSNYEQKFPPSSHRPIVSQLLTLCTLVSIIALGAIAAVIVTMLTNNC